MIKKWFLLFASLAAGCAAQGGPSIGVEEAARLAEDKETFVLDVRTPEEYAQGHLAGAVLIPVQDIAQRTDGLPADKERPILVYCRSGNRSGRAQRFLMEMGYRNVVNLKGGTLSWSAENKPLVK